MKKILLLMITILILTACGTSQEDAETEKAIETEAKMEVSETIEKIKETEEASDKIIKIGTTGGSTTMEITEIAVNLLKDQGYEAEMVVFSDFNVPNTALAEGSIDYNFMQHEPYLISFNEANGTDLVPIGEPIFSPLQGIFSFKISSLDEVEDGMKVVIPNDAANRSDSLKMLEKVGLIKLAEGEDERANVDVTNIAGNPHNLEFIEVALGSVPSVGKDVDIIVTNLQPWIDGGNSLDEAFYVEANPNKSMRIVTRPELVETNVELNQVICDVFASKEVGDYLKENYSEVNQIMFEYEDK